MLSEAKPAVSDPAVAGNSNPLAPDTEPWLAALINHAADAPSESTGPKRAQVELAFNEYCQRRNDGDPVDADIFCEQFPSFQSSLGRLIRAHHTLEDHPEMMGEARKACWPASGQTFVGFQLDRLLGKGGFARVFLATEPALGNRRVAVKVSAGGSAEAHTLGRINHPNIVPVYSVQHDLTRSLTAVCMPYLGSATLCDVLDRVKERMPTHGRAILEAVADRETADQALAGKQSWSPLRSSSYAEGICLIGAQLADALQFIHERKICHRDLKPSNVLMTPEGRPMLLDFNLSTDAQTVETRVGGTLPYMSPEQLLATGSGHASDTAMLDARSDLFSLGVMLYELLTGTHPFGPLPIKLRAAEMRPLLLARQQQGTVPLRDLNPHVDPKVAVLIERCLAYNPKDRPQQAAELAVVLSRGQSPLRRAWRFAGAHPWLTAAAVVVVLGFAGTATAWWSQKETDQAMHWRLSKEARQQHNWKDAVKHLTSLHEAQPDRRDLLVARARAYMQWGESDKDYFNSAFADLQSADKLQPSGEISAGRGYCLLRLGGITDQARMNFDDAIKQGFASAAVYNDLAYCQMLQGKWSDAEGNLNIALELDPKLPAALHNRGMLRVVQTLTVGGFKHSSQSVDAARQIRSWLKQGKSDLQQTLRAGPGSMELYRDAAQLWALSAAYYPAERDREDALSYLEAAVAHGYDPEAIVRDGMFAALKDDARFKRFANLQVASQAMPPTVRIVDPLLH